MRDMSKEIVAAAAVVAVLDGAFAIAYYAGVQHACTAPQVFQSVAAGLLGRAAFRGGATTVALGLAFHFTVALGWSFGYAMVRRRWPALRRWTRGSLGALAVGGVYGVIVWLGMDFVVLPLTHAHPTPLASPSFLVLLAWHAVGVGAPMALIVRRG